MSEDQAMATDYAVIPNDDGTRRINEAHLHDRAIATNSKTGIRKLQPTHKDLLVKVGSFTDFNLRCIEKVHRADLNVGFEPNFLAPNNREKSNRGIVPHFDPISTDYRTETKCYPFADSIALHSVKKDLDKTWP